MHGPDYTSDVNDVKPDKLFQRTQMQVRLHTKIISMR